MTFQELTKAILFDRENYKLLYEGVHALHDLYSSVTGVAAVNNNDNNIYLPTGKAISPGQAAHCLLDLRRTAVFMRGIYKAILRLQQDFPGEPLHILYAGCGPYATLMTPLTTMFGPGQIRLHLMDVQQASLDAVRKLYDHLQAGPYVEEYICADAAVYSFTRSFHLVIVEAMQAALVGEPQVAITFNIVPQLGPKAIFIPQEISVSVQLHDREAEMNSYAVGASTPERINLGEVLRIGQFCPLEPQPVNVSVPAAVGSNNELYLVTELIVYEDERLDMNNSGITLPKRVADVEPCLGRELRFEYEVGERPGFRWQVVGSGMAVV